MTFAERQTELCLKLLFLVFVSSKLVCPEPSLCPRAHSLSVTSAASATECFCQVTCVFPKDLEREVKTGTPSSSVAQHGSEPWISRAVFLLCLWRITWLASKTRAPPFPLTLRGVGISGEQQSTTPNRSTARKRAVGESCALSSGPAHKKALRDSRELRVPNEGNLRGSTFF